MPAYSVYGEDTNTASTSILYVVNGATSPRRLSLYEFIVGSDHVPVDNAFQYNIRRITDEAATPAGTAVTPVKLDEQDPVALSNGVAGPGAEPTYEAGQILELPLNQRATFRWIASPGKEFKVAATEDHGFGIFVAQAATAVVANATMLYEE